MEGRLEGETQFPFKTTLLSCQLLQRQLRSVFATIRTNKESTRKAMLFTLAIFAAIFAAILSVISRRFQIALVNYWRFKSPWNGQ